MFLFSISFYLNTSNFFCFCTLCSLFLSPLLFSFAAFLLSFSLNTFTYIPIHHLIISISLGYWFVYLFDLCKDTKHSSIYNQIIFLIFVITFILQHLLPDTKLYSSIAIHLLLFFPVQKCECLKVFFYVGIFYFYWPLIRF